MLNEAERKFKIIYYVGFIKLIGHAGRRKQRNMAACEPGKNVLSV